MNDFVLIQDDFFGQDSCDYMIDVYHRFKAMGLTLSRQDQGDASHQKNDDQLYVNGLMGTVQELDLDSLEPFNLFARRFWEYSYPAYAKKFSILNTDAAHTIRLMKVQETQIGGGYHVWHHEDDRPEHMRRLLTFILYLNDVEEGGETEFLYYPKRVKPKAGRLLLWPAGFTHTHRGNPPISNTKYILTGWVEYT